LNRLQTNRWTDRQTDRQTDSRTNGQTDKQCHSRAFSSDELNSNINNKYITTAMPPTTRISVNLMDALQIACNQLSWALPVSGG
jgi:hypothetical protein